MTQYILYYFITSFVLVVGLLIQEFYHHRHESEWRIANMKRQKLRYTKRMIKLLIFTPVVIVGMGTYNFFEWLFRD